MLLFCLGLIIGAVVGTGLALFFLIAHDPGDDETMEQPARLDSYAKRK